jgi:hypothetical protein
MKPIRPAVVALVALTLAAAAVVLAQGPPQAPPAGAPGARGPGGRGPEEPPKNLQVLPKDLTRRQVIDIMRGFATALDVECSFCHAAKDPKDPETLDFASDEKDEKKTARLMIGMVKTINTQYIEKVAMLGDDVEVSCVTCHRGRTEPQTLEQALERPLSEGGATAALKTYGELRAKYYGRAAFDFGPDSLAMIGGKLAREQKFADARALLEFNARQFPDSQRTLAILADVEAASGDRAGAIATLKQLLSLAPDNERAKQRLEELSQPEEN